MSADSFEHIRRRADKGPYVVDTCHGMVGGPAVIGPSGVTGFMQGEENQRKAEQLARDRNVIWACGYEAALAEIAKPQKPAGDDERLLDLILSGGTATMEEVEAIRNLGSSAAVIPLALIERIRTRLRNADTERDVMLEDLGRLLEALDLGDYARPFSPHEVMGQCIEVTRQLIQKLDRLTDPAERDPER